MQADFVLGKWKKEEIPLIQKKIQQSIEVIESFASIGIDKTMSLYNNTQCDI
jgi:PTH1 family peptidyl-tRNA hydrolase